MKVAITFVYFANNHSNCMFSLIRFCFQIHPSHLSFLLFFHMGCICKINLEANGVVKSLLQTLHAYPWFQSAMVRKELMIYVSLSKPSLQI